MTHKIVIYLIVMGLLLTWAIPTTAETASPKPVWKAALMSAILPGSGEFYTGATKNGIAMLGLGAYVWGSYLYKSSRVNALEEKYQEYAYLYGDIPPDTYSDDYYLALSRYSTIDEYRQKRGTPPEGPGWDFTEHPREWQVYREAHGDYIDTKKVRDQFKSAIFITHAVSVLDAIIAARIYNKRQRHFSLHVNSDVLESTIQTRLTYRF
ncbi:MAG: hypothetical protein D6675_02065 [Gemmatimonadetes bacterium]|nr:MAG: hypothetical protein D6675_02065 [Gemmatimonadota bacterium]